MHIYNKSYIHTIEGTLKLQMFTSLICRWYHFKNDCCCIRSGAGIAQSVHGVGYGLDNERLASR